MMEWMPPLDLPQGGCGAGDTLGSTLHVKARISALAERVFTFTF